MKVKIVALCMVLLLSGTLAGCGAKTCKVGGCNDTEIYEDGYCRFHYYENVGENILQDLFD